MNNALKALLATFLVVAIGLMLMLSFFFVQRADQIGSILDATAAAADNLAKASANLNVTLARIDHVAQLQEAQLSSDVTQRTLQGTLEAVTEIRGTIKLINLTTVPQLNRTLGALQASAEGLEGTTGSATAAIDSFGRLGEGIRPQIEAVLDETGATVARAGMLISQIEKDEARIAAEAAATLEQTRAVGAQLTVISANLASASEQAPAIARNLESVTRKGPLWSRAFGAIRTVAVLAGAIW